MLDVSTIRSEAAKRAAAEDSSEYDNLMKAADAKAKMTIQVRAAAAKQAYEADCNATREWLARQTNIKAASEDIGGGLLPSSDQKVVQLKRPARITSVPQRSVVIAYLPREEGLFPVREVAEQSFDPSYGRRPRAGRPATGKDPVRAIRLSDEFLEKVDGWAANQEDAPGRSEAIRRLVDIGLKAKGGKS